MATKNKTNKSVAKRIKRTAKGKLKHAQCGKRHLNAHFNGSEITRFGDVNLGMAVALPDGLIVPVLRGVNYMGFREIRVRSAGGTTGPLSSAIVIGTCST